MSHVPRALLALLIGASGCMPPCLAAPTTAGLPETEPSSLDGFYLHLGPGALVFDSGAKVRAAGNTIPGGTVSIRTNVTAIGELGFQRDHFGISLTVGFPPLATVRGADTLAPLGDLGRIRYGPAMLSAHYHFTQFGRFRPYIGAGPVLLLVFRNEDLSVQQLKFRDSVGAAVQVGAEYALSQNWGVFFDAKKAYLRTSASAMLGPVPIQAKVKLDPTVLAGGLAFRF